MAKIDKRDILILIFVCMVFVFSGCSSVHQIREQDEVSEEPASLEETWGIQVVGVRPTAEGRILNFRYKIIDPEKSSSLISPKATPYLIDQKTGNTFSVPSLPKVGALKQRGKQAYQDRIYFILFANPGNSVKSGDKVSVVIGDFKAENIVVE